jgi:DNA-binding NarL/FixJ family response regulator
MCSTVAPHAAAPTRTERPRRRILIADDRPEIVRLLRISLELEPDMEVVGEARNGAEAVGLGSALLPDAVILDLQMPLMDGADAIPLLRRVAPDVTIVLYTAAGVIDLNAEELADAIVDKAGPPDELVLQLRLAMDRRDR